PVEKGIGERFPDAHSRRAANGVVQRLEVLDVDGSHDADAAVEQLEDVLIPLLVPAPWHVRVREVIDDTDLWPAPQNRVDVHLFQHHTAILNRTARNDLEIPDLGICVGPPVGLDETHDDTASLTPRIVRIPQHRICLSNTWRGPDVEPQSR